MTFNALRLGAFFLADGHRVMRKTSRDAAIDLGTSSIARVARETPVVPMFRPEAGWPASGGRSYRPPFCASISA